MAYVRVQQKLHLKGSPPAGKWDVYSNAWFQTSNVVPSSSVRGLFERFFWGIGAPGSDGHWHSMGPFLTGSGAGQHTLWEWDGEAQQKLADYPFAPVSWFVLNPVYMPAQACVAIGYRRPVDGPPQRGRSRFWVGPLVLNSSHLNTSTGALRLTSSAVDLIVSNMVEIIGALSTAGWELVVKTGQGAETTFAAATEVYVDDVFDVMRSRRTYQTHQARSTI